MTDKQIITNPLKHRKELAEAEKAESEAQLAKLKLDAFIKKHGTFSEALAEKHDREYEKNSVINDERTRQEYKKQLDNFMENGGKVEPSLSMRQR